MKAVFSFLALTLAVAFASGAEAQHRHHHGHHHPGPGWVGPNNWHGHNNHWHRPGPPIVVTPPPIVQPPVVVPPPVIVTPPPIDQQRVIYSNQCPAGFVFVYGYGCQQQLIANDLPCYQISTDCGQQAPIYVPEQTYFCAPDYCNQPPAVLPYPQYTRPVPLPSGYGIQAQCRIVQSRRTGRFVVVQFNNQLLPPSVLSYQEAVQVLNSYRMQNVCR